MSVYLPRKVWIRWNICFLSKFSILQKKKSPAALIETQGRQVADMWLRVSWNRIKTWASSEVSVQITPGEHLRVQFQAWISKKIACKCWVHKELCCVSLKCFCFLSFRYKSYYHVNQTNHCTSLKNMHEPTYFAVGSFLGATTQTYQVDWLLLV